MKDIIFLGGTGRCGTSICKKILGFHEDIFSCARETVFLTRIKGIDGYLRNVTSLKELRYELCDRDDFFILSSNGERSSFIEIINASFVKAYDQRNILKEDRLNTEGFILKKFDEHFKENTDRWIQCKGFIADLMNELRAISKKKYILEKTPWTIKMVDKLYYMFPDMKYIHLIRNPLDVISSMRSRKWMDGDVKELVKLYNDVLRAAWFYKQKVPENIITTVNLEDFMVDTESITKKLLKRLDIPFYKKLILDFNKEMTLDKAHIDRWKDNLSKREIEMIKDDCFEIYEKWKEESI